MDAGDRPGAALGCPGWAGWGRGRASAILANTERPSGSGPMPEEDTPPLPFLVLSDPRFERIEGMEEGTGLYPSKR